MSKLSTEKAINDPLSSDDESDLIEKTPRGRKVVNTVGARYLGELEYSTAAWILTVN